MKITLLNKYMKKYNTQYEQLKMIDIYTMSKENKIDLEAPYQRNVVWDDIRSSNYIQSTFMKCAYLPLAFVKSPSKYICIDGKQRITSIIKFMNNEITFDFNSMRIFYSSTGRKSKLKNGRIMTDMEKEEFDNITIPVTYFDNLPYVDQLDIFSRIQQGMPLVTSELTITKLFSDETISNKFIAFCKKKSKVFGRYVIDKRNEHYYVIANILYLVGSKQLFDINRLSSLSFFDKLNLDDLVEHLEIVGTIIDICYGTEVFGNDLFKEIVGKNVQLVSCKLISDLGEVDCTRFREALLKLDRTNKKTDQQSLNKMFSELKGMYECQDEEIEDNIVDVVEEEVVVHKEQEKPKYKKKFYVKS